ncbi:MAG: hypothetical protein FD180_1100 [Planctomycetota bacterium]|nr:MAG: hypothetical protein FD180_1100 [Planctomycetota bacterium]
MKCNELRDKVESGAHLDGDAWEHATSCAHCREEFAHMRALRTSAPEPPAGLRYRVLEAAFPGSARRAFRWQIVAAAAAVALAFVGGISIGRDVERRDVVTAEPGPVVVDKEVLREIVREVQTNRKSDDQDMFVLALALERVYQNQVNCEFEGLVCTKISADKEIFDLIEQCPIARKLWVAANERPDIVVMSR